MSGWQHGENDTAVHIGYGVGRILVVPGGAQAVDAEPGDFLHIPKHVAHGAGNPGSTTAQEFDPAR